jgi:UDP-2,3-diacylglucosamine hydrolase
MFSVESRVLLAGKKIYFASDFHLGIDGNFTSAERENIIVQWLDQIKKDAAILFLLGDQFDYWFEYKEVIPKGFVRLLGKLAEFTDHGIEVNVFTGNHDMWMFTYLQKEIGVTLYKNPVIFNIGETRFLIGHGDGLGPGDHGYKFIKKVFNHPVCQWLFARIHPNSGIGIMKYFSSKSRLLNHNESWDENTEWLVKFSEDYIKQDFVDFLVFGHRHLVIDYLLKNNKSRYINLGDWFTYFSFGEYENNRFSLKFYRSENEIKITNH